LPTAARLFFLELKNPVAGLKKFPASMFSRLRDLPPASRARTSPAKPLSGRAGAAGNSALGKTGA